MIFNSDYHNGLADLAIYYMKLEEEKLLSLLVKYDSPLGVMNSFYYVLIGEAEIKPIEEIEREEKLSYWNQVKDLEITSEKKILISRALYVFNKIRNLDN